MPRGGARPGSGRKKGSGLATKTSAVAKREVASGKLLPLEAMLTAMRRHAAADEWDKAAAIAKDAAPYMHAKLANVAHTGAGGGPIQYIDLNKLTDAELAALEPVIRAMAEEAGPIA